MSIQILHFDPSPLDAQLTWLTLKNDELNPEIEHVESFEEFETALKEQPFDIVLCEYALHKRKTATDVMAYLKAKSIQIPVIVLSKVMDEKVVAEVLKSGASDYVFKTHMSFLPAAIKEVLSKRAVAKPQPQPQSMLSQEFLRNLQNLRAQLAELQPALASSTTPLPDGSSPASTPVVIETLQKKINELTETIATLNNEKLELQQALHEAHAQFQLLKEEKASKESELEQKLAELNKVVTTLNSEKLELQQALDQAQAQIKLLNASKEKNAQLEAQLAETRQALHELSETLQNTQQQATTLATAYEEERQANTQLKAQMLENQEREKTLMDELDKAEETEMQLRIELQEAVITANQIQEAVANLEKQLVQFETLFKHYDAALNEQVATAKAFSEQIQAAKAELAEAQEEKRSLESKLTAAQESAQALTQRFTRELNELRTQLDEERNKRQQLEQELLQATQTLQALQAQPRGNPEREAMLEAELTERTTELAQLKTELAQRNTELAQAYSTASQLHADWEQANREVERLENNVKMLEGSIREKSAKLHEAQKEIKTKEQQLAEKLAILNALNTAVIMVSPTGEIRYWNEGAAIFHGIPAGEALGKKSDEIMKYKYNTSKERKAAIEALQSVGRWNGKVKYLAPNGEQKTADMFISRLSDEMGNPIGVLTVLTDITERMAIENEHRNFKERMELVLNALPVSIIAFDDVGIVTSVVGKPSEQLLTASVTKGKSIYELYAKYPQLLTAFRRVLSGKEVTTSLTGSESQIDFYFSPIFSNGLIAGAVGVLVEKRATLKQA